jgi:hypothetical protein
MEDPVHMVERARDGLDLHRGADGFTADDAVKAEVCHQPLHRAVRDAEAFAQHLPPDLARANRQHLADRRDPMDLAVIVSARRRYACLPGNG